MTAVSRTTAVAVLTCSLAGMVVLAAGMGFIEVSPGEVVAALTEWLRGAAETVDPLKASVVIDVRLPRILCALLVGFGLAVSGAVFQGLLLNPLADPFTLGVASGDPWPTGVVIWTRLAREPLTPDGFGGMPRMDVAVQWQVAEDERFRRGVRRGRSVARARDAHTVHVEVDGLRPGREYHYRFRTGPHRSVVGRTRTAPAYGSSPAALRMAVASCAQLEHGFFSAYRDVAEQRPDLVVHLGDYFYEYEKGGYDLVQLPRRIRDHAGPEAGTLAGYRLRHA